MGYTAAVAVPQVVAYRYFSPPPIHDPIRGGMFVNHEVLTIPGQGSIVYDRRGNIAVFDALDIADSTLEQIVLPATLVGDILRDGHAHREAAARTTDLGDSEELLRGMPLMRTHYDALCRMLGQ